MLDVPTEERVLEIQTGYQPGAIGRCVEMHALYYAQTVGFGRAFEATVAAGVGDFFKRPEKAINQFWFARQNGHIVGTVAVDGEDLGPGVAHLRWFIVGDGLRGSGIGRRLLDTAILFSDQHRFREMQLWTFKGLDAARRLYESSGFTLAEERAGNQWGEKVMEQRFVRITPPENT